MDLGFDQSSVASCAFGSPHKKQFRLLSYLLDTSFFNVRCPGGHKHIPIAGKLTKPSAVYVPKLARHFALAFKEALDRLAVEEAEGPKVDGLESVVLNDLLQTDGWRCDLVWRWKHSWSRTPMLPSSVDLLLRGVT